MIKKLGFTLAEVLITLGIIGIVAILTVPNLIKDHQEQSWLTQSYVFNEKLIQALRVMNTQQVLAGHSTTEDFIAEFQKHSKIIKTCDNTELEKCINIEASEIIDFDDDGKKKKMDLTIMRNSTDFGKPDWGTNIIGVVFANGVSGAFIYNPKCVNSPFDGQFNPISCVIGLYDVSGKAKPNTINRDVRTFGDVHLINGASLKFNGKYWSAPIHAPSVTKAKCEELIGVGNCAWNSDAWAGAAIHCGGLSKLPTKEDLQALAPKLYKNNKPNFYYQDLIDRNKASIFLDKVTPFNNTQLFVIWGNTFKDAYDAAYLNVFIGTAEYNAGHNYVRSSAWENRSFTLCKL